ncbi:MAG TPA: neutral zinc metallopeptidase [Candidatus Dojkabacteria bacterium]|nr:neutral zinc metallopeptidase [Candidatus Dojkabacteria bacterium]HRP51389.1 neutral zinc metallopeptidase [Candidatus Dojkabacteria bacterium]
MARWSKISSRGNVEDRRSLGPVAIGGISLTSIALVFFMNYLNGGGVEGGLNEVLNTVLQQQTQTQQVSDDTSEFAGQDPYEEFASTVLGSNNEAWMNEFEEIDEFYEEPRLVLFRQATQSACGVATSQVGPHYCPADKTIYLDETFFDELTSRFGAQGGDVAQAYVISHEIGHHVQNLLGDLGKLSRGDNETSVAVELQADCYAGVWANSLIDDDVFEPGEIREAMDAAAAVGDDRIQEKIQGYSNPETFTHGSSEEREAWFTKGYDTGDAEVCDTI